MNDDQRIGKGALIAIWVCGRAQRKAIKAAFVKPRKKKKENEPEEPARKP